MRILDNGQNSGRSTSTKVVGTPRFELGTPCTPCEQSLPHKALSDKANYPLFPSRINRTSVSLTCSFMQISEGILDAFARPILRLRSFSHSRTGSLS